MKSFFVFATTPSNFLILLIVFGLFLILLRYRKLGVSSILAGTAGLLTFGYTSAGELLIAPLVTRFPPIVLEEAPPPYGIVLVGGDIHEVHAHSTGALMELGEGGDSIPIAVLLANRYPEAKIIISSGSGGSSTPAPLRPADGIYRVLTSFGLDPERITVESGSGTTYQRARNSAEIIGTQTDKTWWVMTSAHRMPRVIGAFRRNGVNPVPYPVDFRWIPPFDPFYTYRFTDGLEMTDLAMKEWLGLMFYWHQGRTSALFPEPEPFETDQKIPIALSQY